MMMYFDSLAYYQEARVWINDPPDIRYTPVEILKDSISTTSKEHWDKKSVCLEYYRPGGGSYYALLGCEFISQPLDRINIELFVSKDKGEIFESPLISYGNRVYVGIPRTYAGAITKTAIEILSNTVLPPGVLTFNVGAHDEVGSSEFMFSIVTRLILKIITYDLNRLRTKEVEQIILTKVDDIRMTMKNITNLKYGLN
jgi:hypothetical protein